MSEDDETEMVPIDRIGRAVDEERERCAWFVEELARIHERGAIRTRKEGSYNTTALWPFLKRVTYVRQGFERVAQAQDGAAHTLRTAARAIRGGWPIIPPTNEQMRPLTDAEKADL